MPAISEDLKKLLIRTKLTVFPEDFVVVHLPVDIKLIPSEWFRPATTRFAVAIQEPNVFTLVIRRKKWLAMQNMFEKYEVHGPVKLISFDVKLSMVATGYMAAIGTVLTEANISAVPISSFKRDHIFVRKNDLPRTVRLLRQFLENCKKSIPSSSEKKTRRPAKKR
jgi:hypothetical protein